jgi:hypothetical protein
MRSLRLIETLYLSKFFTFIVTLNIIGIFLAIFNVWRYPRNYTSAFVLGNLLVAILMRNELFGRFLYLVVNTLFAKVCLIYFIRLLAQLTLTIDEFAVDSAKVPSGLYLGSSTLGRHSLWMRHVRTSGGLCLCQPRLISSTLAPVACG